MNAYILSPNLELCPIGVVGELCIGGVGLARGYLNHPDLTAQSFIANPFVTEKAHVLEMNSRLYKTGDLCRWLPDGNIEYIERIDHQVKIRGFRVELGEIEACLKERPEIKDAVVMVREDAPGEKRLTAYWIPSDTAVLPNTNELREFIKQHLFPII